MQQRNITSKTYTLKDLFYCQKKFHIPGYQRPYEWRKSQQIEHLLDELLYAFENNSTEIYLMGTLQFNQMDDGFLEVIDGHQRITTFYLILKYLEPNVDSIQFEYRNKISANSDSIDKLIKVSPLYKENYEFITQKLNSVNKAQFLNFLRENILFIAIIINNCSSITETLQIFNSLNTTGLSLDTKDIFKIKFYDFLTFGKSDSQDAIFSKINESYEYVCQPISDEPMYNLSEDDLLDTCRFYLINQQTEKSYANQLKDSNNHFFEEYFNKAQNKDKFTIPIFYNIAHCIKNTQIALCKRDKENADKLTIIKNCARNFIIDSGYGKLCNLYFFLIYIQSQNSMNAISTDMLQNADEIMSSIWKYCSIYRFIHAKVINNVFKNIGEAVFGQDKTIETIKKNVENLLLNISNSGDDFSEFKNLFTNTGDVFNSNKPHLFIKLSYIDDLEEHSYSTYLIKKDLFYRKPWGLNIEHILSRSLYEGDDINSIGNLMYLTDKTNKKLGGITGEILKGRYTPEEKQEKDFASKQQLYSNDRALICVSTFLNKYIRSDFIQQRNSAKIKFFKELYNYSEIFS